MWLKYYYYIRTLNIFERFQLINRFLVYTSNVIIELHEKKMECISIGYIKDILRYIKINISFPFVST